MGSKPARVLDLSSLLETGEWSDFTLVCQNQTFALHKNIICLQSPVLAAALRGKFQEAIKNEITITSFDVATVRHMIQFLYTGDYDIHQQCATHGNAAGAALCCEDDDNELSEASDVAATEEGMGQVALKQGLEVVLGHIHVNGIADYYNIPGLAELTRGNILNYLQNNWDAARFPQILEETFNSTGDRLLVEVMGLIAGDHLDELKDNQALTNLEGVGDFAVGIIRRCAQESKRLVKLVGEVTGEAEAAILAMSRMETCRNKLEATVSCRHCHELFSCYIEKHGTEQDPAFTLRCSECRTRH